MKDRCWRSPKPCCPRPRVLVLDEPTAALTHAETARLFEVVTELKKEDMGVIFISHRLNEVFEVADEVTVLRDGSVVLSGFVEDTTEEELVRAMVGDGDHGAPQYGPGR